MGWVFLYCSSKRFKGLGRVHWIKKKKKVRLKQKMLRSWLVWVKPHEKHCLLHFCFCLSPLSLLRKSPSKQISCYYTVVISMCVWLEFQQQTEGKKTTCKKKKNFIPCKPHRARTQPRSDQGRNRAVTVGIENKKQKHLLYTFNNQLTQRVTKLYFSHFFSGGQ